MPNIENPVPSGPLSEDLAPPIEQQAAALREALCWLADMVCGHWTKPERGCPTCVVDAKGDEQCSTLCAQFRIDAALKALEENPL